MKNKLLTKSTVLLLIASVGIAASILAQLLTMVKINEIANTLSQKSTESSTTIAIEKNLLQLHPKFTLYECGGKIGIYDATTDILVDIIDVLVTSLPQNDRYALKKGITVYSLEELSDLISDFSS